MCPLLEKYGTFIERCNALIEKVSPCADHTGKLDATQALQAAIRYAQTVGAVLLLPSGVYRVTDTLNVSEPTRSLGVVIEGEIPSDRDKGRPTLWVPPHSPAFSNEARPRYVVFFFKFSPRVNASMPDQNFNQGLRGVDITVGEGNRGAIGIRHRAAQLSIIEDVTVHLGDDGYVGVEGLPGAGGSSANVAVYGGRYGIDARLTQPTSLLVGVRLFNQSCHALVYGGLWGQQTLVGAGLEIRVPAKSRTHTGIFVPGRSIATVSGCHLLPADQLPQPDERPPPMADPTQTYRGTAPPNQGWLSIVDSIIYFESSRSGVAVRTYTSVIIENTWIRNGRLVVQFNGTVEKVVDVSVQNLPSTRGRELDCWTHVNTVAIGVRTDPGRWANASLHYTSSVLHPPRPRIQRLVNIAPPDNYSRPPADLRSRHLWDPLIEPSFQSSHAINAMTICGAVGDGIADDTAALQSCIDRATVASSGGSPGIVLLPKGVYLVSTTLQMPEHPLALVGIAHHMSHIKAPVTGLLSAPMTAAPDEPPVPVLRTSTARTWIRGISVLAYLRPNASGTYPLLWRASDPASSLRDFRTRLMVTNNRPPPLIPFPFAQLVLAGNGRVQNWMDDMGKNCGARYRELLIVNSTALSIQMLDPEHGGVFGEEEATVELANATGVTILSAKFEGHSPGIWVNNGSSLTLHGFGGMDSPGFAGQRGDWPPRALFLVTHGSRARLKSLSTRDFGGMGDRDPRMWKAVYFEPSTGGSFTTSALERPVLIEVGSLPAETGALPAVIIEGDETWKCDAGTRNVSSFHISGLGLPAHDMNAIFLWKNTWHVMHQGNGNWRHLVSSNLVRWTRLPDALTGHGSYDGAVTTLNNGDDPVILFDCRGMGDCLPHTRQSLSVGITARSGDPPIVGVARPADSADPLLVNWTKDAANPIKIENSAAAYSGPSNMWLAANGKRQMKMIQMNTSGWTTGLYEATDSSLHSWRLIDPTFYPTSSGGGGIFYELPAAAVIGTTDLTHIMGMGGAFALGKIDAASGKFVAGATANLAVDTFNTVLYSMLGVAEGRMITMGWVLAGPMKSAKAGQYRTSGRHDALTVPRALRFDATNLQLQAMPVPELVQLRGQLLGSHTQTALQEGTSLSLFDKGGATAFDLELFLDLATEAIAVDVVLLASRPAQVANGGLVVGINASALATAGDRRTISLIVAEQKVLAFTLPPGARSLNVRALADRNIAEVFVGDGRGIYTSAVNISGVAVPGAFLTARSPVTLTNSSAWKMGCCWKADRTF
eukprot:SAG31_NODE_830_length_11688_cov_35.424023_3_plen_1278_part_00